MQCRAQLLWPHAEVFRNKAPPIVTPHELHFNLNISSRACFQHSFFSLLALHHTDMATDAAPGQNMSQSMAQNGHGDGDSLVTSADPLHPANYISDLCRRFYSLGWVTGTGGGVSIRHGDQIYLAPSGVQKEMMQPKDMFVLDFQRREYLRRPAVGQHLRVAHLSI